MYNCCLCGEPVEGTGYWVCRRCRKAHNLPKSITDWPEWARAMRREEKRERGERRTVSLDLLEGCLDDGSSHHQQPLNRRKPCLDLPYAPYDDDETNRQYRKANGIKERR